MKRALTYDDVQIIPKYSEVKSRLECKLNTRFTKNKYINIPIIASPMDTICGSDMANTLRHLGGVGILHRFCSISEQCSYIDKQTSCFHVAAVGVTGDWWERSVELINHGCDVLLLDVAHGNHINVKNAINKIKSVYSNIEVIAGNVCTYEGAKNLCEWGVDCVRANIGNGAMCTTRINTGVGIPSITSILDCVRACDAFDVPVIADGGIRYPGDIAKALACGADSVMLGSLLSGTYETPGEIQKIGIWPNETLYKKYRGSASLDMKLDNGYSKQNVEGVSKLVQYKGYVKHIIDDILDGIRSSMSYVGVTNLTEFRINAELIEVTHSGIIEASPHGLEKK